MLYCLYLYLSASLYPFPCPCILSAVVRLKPEIWAAKDKVIQLQARPCTVAEIKRSTASLR